MARAKDLASCHRTSVFQAYQRQRLPPLRDGMSGKGGVSWDMPTTSAPRGGYSQVLSQGDYAHGSDAISCALNRRYVHRLWSRRKEPFWPPFRLIRDFVTS